MGAKTRKIISVFLTVAMLVTLVSLPALAETLDWFTYEISDGTVTITACDTATSGEITIPNEIEGLPVTAIGNYAFKGCAGLTKVIIPENVTFIGDFAFQECTGLETMVLPETVTYLDYAVFYDCSNLVSVEIRCPIKSIRDKMFYGCTKLEEVIIPGSVTYIGDSTFRNCSSLTGINLPGGVNHIGQYAFFGCSKLSSFKIPDKLTELGYAVFTNCKALSSIVIPDSVTTISNNVFRNCSSLKSVTIPNTVTSIGSYAFDGCTGITDVYYSGTETAWSKVTIGKYNTNFTNAIMHYENIVAKGTCGESLTWTFYDSGTLTISGNGKMTGWSSCSDVPWYSIRENITSVIIENGITNIGTCAFGYCSNLTSVAISDSVIIIGGWAFYECSNLASVTIPDSVTWIGDEAFGFCSNLTSVTIGNGVTSIENMAFRYCVSLTNVTIPDSVTNIGNEAFYYCSNLTSVAIGNGVTSIGSGAFSGCESLTSITVDSNNENYSSLDGNLFNKNRTRIIRYAIGKQDAHYTIPDSVTSIGGDAFYGCSNLTSVTIPDSVTSIGYRAFNECYKLTDVYYAGTEEEWNNIAIAVYNESITNATIHFNSNVVAVTGVTLDKETVQLTQGESETLTATVLPEDATDKTVTWESSDMDVATVEDGVITAISEGTAVITATTVDGVYTAECTVTVMSSFVDVIGITLDKETVQLTEGESEALTATVLPEDATEKTVLWESSDTNVATVEDGVITAISEGTAVITATTVDGVYTAECTVTVLAAEQPEPALPFTYEITDEDQVIITGCDTSVSGELVIPGEIEGLPVTAIGDNAFYWCDSLISITIPDSVTSIGDNAFGRCNSLISVTIGSGVTSIGSRAFYDCESLTSITIPDSVTSIGDYAFGRCNSLISVTIGSGVTSIGSGAFSGCESLTSITVDSNNENYSSLDDILFDKNQTTIIKYAPEKQGTHYTIPASVTSIGDGAFSFCSNLTSVTIPDGVTSIGYDAFCLCERLTSITVDGNNENYSSLEGNLFDKNQTTIINYAPGKQDTHYTIPDSVTSIGAGAFSSSSNLIGVTIGSGVTSIGSRAFSDCESLTSITIPDSVTTIGECMFEGCGNLTSVTIPNTMTTIGECMFEGCGNLTSVTIPNSVTTIEYNAFYNCYSLANITIPNRVTSIDECAFEGCENLASITIPESVTSIGYRAFNECYNLTDVYYAGTEEEWDNIEIGRHNECLIYATIHFQSIQSVPVESIELDTYAVQLTEGESETLTATVLPEDATDKNIVWESSDMDVATVEDGVIIAISEGTAVITVTTADGGYTAECTVTVISSSVDVSGITLDKETVQLTEGESVTLTATVLPEDATEKTVLWESSDTNVATVEDGVITAISEGTAVITVTTADGKYTASCVVKVKEKITDENAPKITISSIKARPGNVIEVTVDLANNTGFASMGIEVGYNTDIMTLTEVTPNENVGGIFTPGPSYTKTPFNFGWDSESNINFNGTLATLTFVINDDAPDGIYPITVDFYKGINGDYIDGDDTNYDENFDAVGFVYVDGEVKVVSYTPGDLSGDGRVNNKDATYILRYLARWEVPDIVADALDIDGNGSVNNKDATILLRYLAGWDVTLN